VDRPASGDLEMPLRLTLLVYPLFAIAVAASRNGGIGPFLQAGAISPETARKPASLCIRNVDAVRSAARRGILIDVGNGRYYLNQGKYRRRRRLTTAVLVSAGVVIGLLTILAFMPGGA
jgi:hypothetical protein